MGEEGAEEGVRKELFQSKCLFSLDPISLSDL